MRSSDRQVTIKCTRVHPDAKLPTRGTEGAAGWDLYACLPVSLQRVLISGERVTIPIGLKLAIPQGYEGQIRPRSGLASRSGITVLNAPGTVDSDFRGEVGVTLINLSATTKIINHGDRIAQLVIQRVPEVAFVEVEGLDETARGAGGFGSTGR